MKKAEKEVLVVAQSGYDEMVAELERRRTTDRDEIANDLVEAKELGDLSENTAYSNAMERKELNENRISELEYLISIAQITTVSANDKIINIGHTVEIQKVGGSKREVILVGKSESQQADPTVGKVSVDSPIGEALHGSQIGDTVIVKLPSGEAKYKINRIVA